MGDTSTRLVLRQLSLPTRLVLAAFLIASGVGYIAGLVQMHFQHASAGEWLPRPEETSAIYHGQPGQSQFERLLLADETRPFNGSGSMRAAFTARSARWKQLTRNKPRDAVQKLIAERDGERLALVDWARSGASAEAYRNDRYLLPPELANQPVTENYLDESSGGGRAVKIASIVKDRCARCHASNASSAAAAFPLETVEDVQAYCEHEVAGGMSLAKLAQTTHVHLLGFTVLFCLTGLVFSLSSYPGVVRGVIGPLPLVAQLADISCWWLSRSDAAFTRILLITGGVVALSLLAQVLLGLFNLFGKAGKATLVLMLAATVAGGFVVKERVLEPYLQSEKLAPEIRDESQKPERQASHSPKASESGSNGASSAGRAKER